MECHSIQFTTISINVERGIVKILFKYRYFQDLLIDIDIDISNRASPKCFDLSSKRLLLPACWQFALFPELLQLSVLSSSLHRVLESVVGKSVTNSRQNV